MQEGLEMMRCVKAHCRGEKRAREEAGVEFKKRAKQDDTVYC